MQNKKKINPEKTSSSNSVFLTLFATLIIGVILTSLVRQNSEKLYPPATISHQKKEAEDWLQAIKKNDSKKAILIAEKMVSTSPPIMPDSDYIQLLMSLKLGTMILTSPFNQFDFMRWQDALTVKEIVESPEIQDKKDEFKLEAMFRKMQAKVKRLPKPVKNYRSSPSLTEIWRKKNASTMELCRLFAAIAGQAGYDVQIVILHNKNRQVIHMFCEIRQGNKSFVADPRFDFFSVDASAALFAGESASIPKAWPKMLSAGIHNRIYELPAEVGDYKKVNQLLYNKLSLLAGSEVPLFGKAPRGRIDAYLKKYPNKTQNTWFSYWTFPFNSLMSSPKFPNDWRLKKRKTVK